MSCIVCDHKERDAIEQRLVKMSVETGSDSYVVAMEKISRDYDVPVEELQRHMLECGDTNSLARQIKLSEAVMLEQVSQEYLGTMQRVGSSIRKLSEGDDLVAFAKLITKPVTDLYIGSGEGVRKTVGSLVEINQILNGPKDTGQNGLVLLAAALRGSDD